MNTRLLIPPAVTAAVLLLAACGNVPPPPRPAPNTAATTTTPVPTISSTPPPPIDTRTPVQKQVDERAAALGYTTPSWPHKYPHQELEATCRAMTESGQLAYPPATWLVGTLLAAKNRDQLIALYRAGFELLCPPQMATLDAALTGAAPVESGTEEIGAELGKMRPGRWRNVKAVDDCYWERTAPNGAILANQFATHANTGGITVTIRPGDGSFTSRGCGIWERVS